MGTNVKRIDLDELQQKFVDELLTRKYIEGQLGGFCAMCREYGLSESPCEPMVDDVAYFVAHKKPKDCPALKYLAEVYEFDVEDGGDLLDHLKTDTLEAALFGTYPVGTDVPATYEELKESKK